MQQALWWLDMLDATVGRAEALISRKELATQALDAATGCAQGLGELAQLLTRWPSWSPAPTEPEPTWLLETASCQRIRALTAANLNVSAATLLKQLTAVQDALEARRDKTEDSGQIDQLGSELGFLLPAPRRWRRCGADVRHPPEGAPPIANGSPPASLAAAGDWQVCASPVSAAADLANNLAAGVQARVLTSPRCARWLV